MARASGAGGYSFNALRKVPSALALALVAGGRLPIAHAARRSADFTAVNACVLFCAARAWVTHHLAHTQS